MPEGDTIRRIADSVTVRLVGQRCTGTVTRDPRLDGVDFSGTTLDSADAVGKHLFLRFSDGRSLHAHLLMTGKIVVGRPASVAPMRRRIEIGFEHGQFTGVDVPLLEVVPTRAEGEIIGHLGPDLCGPAAPDLDEITNRMLHAPTSLLAGAILDQRNAAGFGNVYAVEVPFITGLHPLQPVGSVDGLRDVIGIGAALIRANARLGPQNTTGRKLSTDDHFVYPKRGRPCPLCSARLQGFDEDRSPWGRPATWCPACQPAPGEPVRRVAADVDRAIRLLALHPARREASFPQRGTPR